MKKETLRNGILNACQKIAPAWPLENSVAVNPYLGLSKMSFDEAAQILDARGGIQMYMPLEFYFEQIQKKEITRIDIEKALRKKRLNFSINDFLKIANKLKSKERKPFKGAVISDLASQNSKTDYAEIMVEQVSSWLTSYFNKFSNGKQDAFYNAWKNEMTIDLLPEVMGLDCFRENVSTLPDDPEEAICFAIEKIGIPDDWVEEYLHALLLKLIGWASYCAGEDWQNNLYGGYIDHLQSLLAILTSWEYCIVCLMDKDKKKRLRSELKQAILNDNYDDYLTAQTILQESFEVAAQRKLRKKFEVTEKEPKIKQRAKAQIAFCIDVRSEVYRRNLEQVNDQIETIGFAGFFGIPLKYQPMIDSEGKNQCPVLIPSGYQVQETTIKEEDLTKTKKKRTLMGSLRSAWISFKSGTVSSFSFVSPLGLFFLPKLIGDTMGWSRPVADPKKAEFGSLLRGKGKLDLSEIPFEEQVAMAKSTLLGMGLTKDFAPVVLFTGHGSSSVNNPHATGLDCGACGGNSGEVNAIAAAMILNDKNVRKILSEQHDICIPEDTLFMACLHDTTTDKISVLNENTIPDSHQHLMKGIKESLSKASSRARKNRSKRLVGLNKKDIDAAIYKNANDWSQVRPEWGLAGCNSFIVAPRERTRGVDLEGKAFLHSYDWKTDTEYQILETIMTAPMIVTSWINLQYYASTTDNKKLGAGNKTLHNVIGGMGVIEGAKGDLRIGLPIQSLHDGDQYQHLPQKLNVVIEAPMDAINQILQKNPGVKELCDNQWITLLIMNEKGRINYRYEKDLKWESYDNEVIVKERETVKELAEIL